MRIRDTGSGDVEGGRDAEKYVGRKEAIAAVVPGGLARAGQVSDRLD